MLNLLRDPVFRDTQVGKHEQSDFSMKERLEHANHSAELNAFGNGGDMAEVVPVLDAKNAIIP
jgi:hypothetical protein